MLKKAILVLLSVMTLAGCGGSLSSHKMPAEIMSPFVLNDNMMELKWQSDIPLKHSEKIRQSFIYNDDIFVITSSNLIFCMDRFTGQLKFVRAISSPGLPVSAPEIYKSKVYLSVGNDVVSVDPKDYKVTRTFTLLDVPTADIAISKGYLYSAQIDGRMHCYDEADSITVFTAKPDDQSGIYSFTVDEKRIYMVSNAGNVYAISKTEPKKYWVYTLIGGKGAYIMERDGYLYLTGSGGTIYKLKASSGMLVWKRVLGATQGRSVKIVGDIVIVETTDKGTYALDIETGVVRWHCGECGLLLSGYRDEMFLLTKDALVSIDKSTGKLLKKIEAHNAAGGIYNDQDSNIYVYDKAGRLCCVDVLK